MEGGNVGRRDLGKRFSEPLGIAPFVDLGDHCLHELFFHLFGGKFRIGDGEDGIGVRFSF